MVLLAAAPARAQNALPAGALAILNQAKELELLSLDPGSEKEPVKNGFHGYKVLGSTLIKEADRRKQLVQALTAGMAQKANPARCFSPRHGIRASHDGKTVTLVICFECSQLDVYEAPAGARRLLISTSPEPVLDRMLKDAGIPKAK
jgi:hypothetical protein